MIRRIRKSLAVFSFPFALAVTSLPAASPGQPGDKQSIMAAHLESCREKGIDIIFVGDSITADMILDDGQSVWKKYYAGHSLNFGSGGDQFAQVIQRLDKLDKRGLDPKVAVLLIGTNNYGQSPEEIAAGVKSNIAKIRSEFPAARIIVCSILPNARANERMMAANEIIRTFGDDKRIYYLDLVPSFPQEGDNWRGLKSDKIHVTNEGYEAWAAALNPLLQKLGASTTGK